MNIKTVDLNLLKTFDALYRERNVTRAGNALGLAQPSMSNALNRLRALFDDPLFLRSPAGMQPTERAVQLAPAIGQALQDIRKLIQPAEAFDPETVELELVIACSDNLTLRIGPMLAAHLQQHAPGIDLRFVPIDKKNAFDVLDDRSVDILIGVFAQIPARFFQTALFGDEFVCIARSSHPHIKKNLTLKLFTQLSHVLMTLNADSSGAVDKALKARGLKRRVAMTTGQFLVIPDIVANTDFIASIPRSLAVDVAIRSGCKIYEAPLKLPEWTNSVVWSQSTNAATAKRYVIDEVSKLVRKLNSVAP